MKTEKQLKERLNSLQDSLTRLNEELAENFNYEESLEIVREIDGIEAKISILRWVLQN